jgi:AcrR family transcriptional regulator
VATRTNQKERTRQALLEAARVIMSDGLELTISGAAAVARVSSATAYRYFSQPQQLALEAVADRASGVIADLPDAPAARLDEVVRRLAELQLADEPLWRAVLAASLQRWSTEQPDGGTALRSGARREMTRRALEPLEPVLDPAQHRRLTSAVMLVHGMEAMVSARDACGLDPDETVEVMRWAARALLDAALREAGAGTDEQPG